MRKITRVKCYWDERQTTPAWSWSAWSGDDIVDSGSDKPECYTSALACVQDVVFQLRGIHVQDSDIAHLPTEGGDWAEWTEITDDIGWQEH